MKSNKDGYMVFPFRSAATTAQLWADGIFVNISDAFTVWVKRLRLSFARMMMGGLLGLKGAKCAG
jgi:hypothetical protein